MIVQRIENKRVTSSEMEIARCSESGQHEQPLQFYELANEVSERPNQSYGMGLFFLGATVHLLI